MRVATTFFFSSLVAFFIPSIAAAQFPRPGSNLNHKTFASRALASRQYKIRRDIIDVCVSIDEQAFAAVALLFNLEVYAALKICLCLNDLDLWLDSNADARVLVGLLGRSIVLATITQLLTVNVGTDLNPFPSTCTFPPHGIRLCVPGKPCAFGCGDGYTEMEDACICLEPNTECNGQCGDFTKGCGTLPPVPHRRSIPVTTLARAKATCKRNESVCGVPGRERFAFECVDTQVSLDSCGGCVTPHPFFEPHRSIVTGVECGRLPSALHSRCVNSRCVVTRCKDGFEPSSDKASCVVSPSATQKFIANAEIVGSPTRLEKRTTPVTPSAELRAQIQAFANLVIGLSDACQTFPTSSDSPAIDYDAQVQNVISATTALLDTNTVANIVVNVKALVDVTTSFKEKLYSCRCVEHLGLGVLLVKLDAVVVAAQGLQNWCQENTIWFSILLDIPTSDISLHSPISNNSSLPIDLGLHALSEVIMHISAKAVANASAVGGVDAVVITKVSALAHLALELVAGAASLPPAPVGSTPIPIPIIGNPELPVDTCLVQAVVQATVNLLASSTVSALVANIEAIVSLNALVATTFENCGCVDRLGLAHFVGLLDAVGHTSLDLKDMVNVSHAAPGAIGLGFDPLLAELAAKLSVVGPSSLNLKATVSSVVSLVIALQDKVQAAFGLVPVAQSVSSGLTSRDMLGDLLAATVSLVGSSAVSEFRTNVRALVDACIVLSKMLDGCGCIESLGLSEVRTGVDVVSRAATDFQHLVGTNTIPEPTAPNKVVANADELLKSLATSVASK